LKKNPDNLIFLY